MLTSLWSVKCGEPLFNQALHDSRENRSMADLSTFGWVRSCVFLIYGDCDGRFPLGGKSAALDSLSMLANGIRIPATPAEKMAGGN